MTGEGAAADPIPASTVVLTRPTPHGDGLEVLLTRRPATMAFAPEMHVFPGGRIDDADDDPRLLERAAPDGAAPLRDGAVDVAAVAAIREAFEEVGILLADLPPGAARGLAAARADMLDGRASFIDVVERLDARLRTDVLIPLSRWVTPPTLPRRFDARVYVAPAPTGVDATLLGAEVEAHEWQTPRAALDAMAAGRIGLWAPTSSTLQQLEHVGSIDDVRERLAAGPLGDLEVEEMTADIVRIRMPAGGGIAGQPVHAYLVGRARAVLVDPGDPTGPGLDRAVAVAAERGAAIVGIALTHADPDHAGGAEALAETLRVPIHGGPGVGRDLPSDPVEMKDGTIIDIGDVPLRVVATPGPRPDHVSFVVGSGASAVVIAGDLDGVRGARSMPAPADEAAWSRSVARLRSVAPGSRWLGGHPDGRST
ncbi:MAG: MBL fold metallo-hydrolase [Candidatus Limnocylindria bacterium]